MRRRKWPGLVVAFAMAFAGATGAGAQTYPDKAIKLVIPYPPGSGTDTLARHTARKLEERFGKPVVPENRAGSSGVVAAQAVIASPPDGYTLFFVANAPVATNAALFEKLPYDPVKDLTPIARVAQGSFGLVVPAGSPYRTAKDLLAAAAAQPGKMNYGSGSAFYHIATEWLLSLASAKANMVPYKGVAPALTDLAGGQLDFALSEYGGLRPLVQSGKLRLLAVTSASRIAAEPDIPTLQETGFPSYTPVAWWAVFGPPGMPRPIVERLERTLLDVFATEESRKFLLENNLAPYPADARTLGQFQRAEIEREVRIVEQARIPRQ